MILKSDNGKPDPGRQRNKVNSVGGYCTYEAAVSDVPRYYQHLKDGSFTTSFIATKGFHARHVLISPVLY